MCAWSELQALQFTHYQDVFETLDVDEWTRSANEPEHYKSDKCLK